MTTRRRRVVPVQRAQRLPAVKKAANKGPVTVGTVIGGFIGVIIVRFIWGVFRAVFK